MQASILTKTEARQTAMSTSKRCKPRGYTFRAVAGFAAGSALVASWSGILRAVLAALPGAFEVDAGAGAEGFLLSCLAAEAFPLQELL